MAEKVVPMSTNSEAAYNVALVGASSLRGKEIKGVLGERHFPVRRLVLLDAQEVGGQLTEFEDEPAIIEPIGRESFEGVALAIFASSPEFTKHHWVFAESSGCAIIDASYFLESHPSARLLAPAIEKLWNGCQEASGEPLAGSRISVPAHPVAMAIAAVLGRMASLSAVQRAVVTVYEPVSERGEAGVNELHQQTLKLLSFQPIPRSVFDSQVAFTMLSRYGEESRPTLDEVQQRILSHVVKLLKGRAGAPALRVFHAPVFHGQAFSCYLELSEAPAPESIEDALDQKPLKACRGLDMEPNMADVAGSEDITLGRVVKDASVQAGYWIWGVLDNLKLAAINTVDIAERLLAERLDHKA